MNELKMDVARDLLGLSLSTKPLFSAHSGTIDHLRHGL